MIFLIWMSLVLKKRQFDAELTSHTANALWGLLIFTQKPPEIHQKSIGTIPEHVRNNVLKAGPHIQFWGVRTRFPLNLHYTGKPLYHAGCKASGYDIFQRVHIQFRGVSKLYMYLSEQGGLSKLYRYNRPAQILRTERRFYWKTRSSFWFWTYYRSVLRIQLESKDLDASALSRQQIKNGPSTAETVPRPTHNNTAETSSTTNRLGGHRHYSIPSRKRKGFLAR